MTASLESGRLLISDFSTLESQTVVILIQPRESGLLIKSPTCLYRFRFWRSLLFSSAQLRPARVARVMASEAARVRGANWNSKRG